VRFPTRALERCLFLIALLGLGAAALAQLQGVLFEAREGPRLEALLGEERITRSSPGLAVETRKAAAAGNAWGRLELPRIGMSSLVAEGTDAGTLRVAVGHLPESAFPGEGGNVGLAGHRDTVFRPLKDVAPGDLVRLQTPDGVFEYRVQWTTVVDPTRTDLLEPTAEPALTLVTCYPFSYVGRAPLRFVVRASRAASSGDDADPVAGRLPAHVTEWRAGEEVR